MRLLVGHRNGSRTRKNRLCMVLTLPHPTKDFVFRFDRFGGGELAVWNSLMPLNDLKFSGCQACF
jgi:hypothetical protein